MADDNNSMKGPKTKPLRKTSAVPLRKETVRVTLKATPAGASGAPRPPAPAPPKPPSVATTPLETSPVEESFDANVDPNTAPISLSAEPELPDVTSSVPLRQETMRVTLKSDNSGAPMAPAPTPDSSPAPSAPTPSAQPTPGSAPAPTIPLGAAPKASGPAPTIPLAGGGGNSPQPASPAPTIPLSTGPMPTVPLGMPGTSSQPLPKATVELQQTQQLSGAPLGGPSQMPTLQTEWESEMNRGEGLVKILAVAAFIVALAALGVQLMHAKHWLDEHKKGDWMTLTEPEVKFDKKSNQEEYVNKY